MRYVFGKWFLPFCALLLAGCVRDAGNLSQPAALLLDENGCRLDAAEHKRQYFVSAVVYLSGIRPRSDAGVEPEIRFDQPLELDLLAPGEGLASAMAVLAPGSYDGFRLELSSAAISLAAAPTRIVGLSVTGSRIEVDLLGGFVQEATGTGLEISACVDGLRVENGAARLNPNRILVNRAVRRE